MAHLRAADLARGNEQFLGAAAAGVLAQVLHHAEHRHPVQLHAHLVRRHGHQAHRPVGQVRVVLQFAQHLFRRVARADEQEPAFLHLLVSEHQAAGALEPLVHVADGHAVRSDQPEGKQRIENEHRAREPGEAVAEQQQGHDEERGGHGHEKDADDVVQAGVAPHAPVQATQVEQRDLDEQDQRQQAGEAQQLVGFQVRLEAEHVGQVVRQHHEQDVQPENAPEFGVPRQVAEQSPLGGKAVEYGGKHGGGLLCDGGAKNVQAAGCNEPPVSAGRVLARGGRRRVLPAGSVNGFTGRRCSAGTGSGRGWCRSGGK